MNCCSKQNVVNLKLIDHNNHDQVLVMVETNFKYKIARSEALVLIENQPKLSTLFHKLEKFIIGSFSVSFKTIESRFEG